MIVVTGATSGIGAAVARSLVARGLELGIVARDAGRGESFREQLRATGATSPIHLFVADLSSMGEVRRLADRIQGSHARLEALVNNAGVDVGRRQTTGEGHELTFAVNYLAPFLLTTRLLDLLRRSAPARVVNVASGGHRGGHIDFADLEHERRFSGQRAYNDSKLALVLFTYELARRLQGSGVTANCVDPGFVKHTDIGRTLPWGYQLIGALLTPFMAEPEQAAETIVQAVCAGELATTSGVYLKGGRAIRSSQQSYDTGLARRLWDRTEALLASA
jgi:NAD(P)-dependent dehydrogenase (short-subunit alcohol dehydrogenase family)